MTGTAKGTVTEPDCYRASVSLGQAQAEALAEVLGERLQPPPDAVSLYEQPDGQWRVDAYFLAAPDSERLEHLALQLSPEARVSIEAVPPTDWVALSQQSLPPVHVGRFLVHGSHDRGTVARNRWTIEIDAAQAFGTAHHASTRGCLEMLDGFAKRQRFSNILDIGTGTGILAILAARQWCTQVVASDIDPLASGIARDNARANGAAALVTTVTAAGLAHPEIRRRAPYDLVLANILARPLTRLAKGLSRAVKRGGFVVLSGITRNQAGRVAAAYRAAGFTRHREIAIEDWVTLALRRS